MIETREPVKMIELPFRILNENHTSPIVVIALILPNQITLSLKQPFVYTCMFYKRLR